MNRLAAAAVFLAVLIGLGTWAAPTDRLTFMAGAGAVAVALVAACVVLTIDGGRRHGGPR